MEKKQCKQYSPTEWGEFIEEYSESQSLPEVKNRTKLAIEQIRRMRVYVNRNAKQFNHPSLPLRELEGPKRRSTPVDYVRFEEVYRKSETLEQVRVEFSISKTEVNRRIQVLAERGIELPALPESDADVSKYERPFRRLQHGSNPKDFARKQNGTRYEDTKRNGRVAVSYVRTVNFFRKYKRLNERAD